jgi:hypothetical protein
MRKIVDYNPFIMAASAALNSGTEQDFSMPSGKSYAGR